MIASFDDRYMEFRIGQQLYAIPLLTVKEVISKPEITLVPNMPPHFEGMFNLRGQILGVFNVRRKLDGKKSEVAGTTHEVIIVIEQHGVSVGMTVDEVTRVFHTEPSMISPAPLKEDDPARKFVDSVIQLEQQLIPTINVSQLLEIEKYKNTLKAS